MSDEYEYNISSSDMESMDAYDWKEYLRENTDRCLVVEDIRGTHTFQFDSHEERVTFYAYGSMGYDRDGTQAALDEIEGTSDGLTVYESDML